jgi:hypothetical protein
MVKIVDTFDIITKTCKPINKPSPRDEIINIRYTRLDSNPINVIIESEVRYIDRRKVESGVNN